MNAGGNSRVFLVDGTASISGLTITGGVANASSPYIASAGGGVVNFATLTLTADVLSNNEALGDPSASPLGIDGLGAGGGVGNLGTLTVRGCTFTDNQAVGGSGSSGSVHAGSGAGGGIANLAVANVTNSTFTGNLAQGGSNSSGNDAGGAGGGGIVNFVARLTVAGSTFTDNQAQGGNDNSGSIFAGVAAGGAIDSLGTAATSLVVSQGTFTNNEAQGGSDNQGSSFAGGGFGGGISVGQGVATISNDPLRTQLGSGWPRGVGANSANGAGGGLNSFNLTGRVRSSASAVPGSPTTPRRVVPVGRVPTAARASAAAFRASWRDDQLEQHPVVPQRRPGRCRRRWRQQR